MGIDFLRLKRSSLEAPSFRNVELRSHVKLLSSASPSADIRSRTPAIKTTSAITPINYGAEVDSNSWAVSRFVLVAHMVADRMSLVGRHRQERPRSIRNSVAAVPRERLPGVVSPF